MSDDPHPSPAAEDDIGQNDIGQVGIGTDKGGKTTIATGAETGPGRAGAPAIDTPSETDGPGAGHAGAEHRDAASIVLDDLPDAFAGVVSGTRLATADGPVAVEDLTVGTLVVTASGAVRPIRWIGHRTVSCRGHADLQPIRIAAETFGEGHPERDLLVSPGQGLCLDVLGEVLIPAGRLVNGVTLTPVVLESVTYWHVELGDHDILLAEGLPIESGRDPGPRGAFAAAVGEGGPTCAPEAPVRLVAGPCRPVHDAGLLIDVLHIRLLDRARAMGWHLVEAPLADLRLVADGQVIRPDIVDLTARFVLPAEACAVHLVSDTGVPAYVQPGSTDTRRLGVALSALSFDDGLTGLRRITLDDPRLETGFHPCDGEGEAAWRWTDGAALLPASLWEGCRGTLFLRVTLFRPALPRWVGPRETAGVIDLSGFRRPQ